MYLAQLESCPLMPCARNPENRGLSTSMEATLHWCSFGIMRTCRLAMLTRHGRVGYGAILAGTAALVCAAAVLVDFPSLIIDGQMFSGLGSNGGSDQTRQHGRESRIVERPPASRMQEILNHHGFHRAASFT